MRRLRGGPGPLTCRAGSGGRRGAFSSSGGKRFQSATADAREGEIVSSVAEDAGAILSVGALRAAAGDPDATEYRNDSGSRPADLGGGAAGPAGGGGSAPGDARSTGRGRGGGRARRGAGCSPGGRRARKCRPGRPGVWRSRAWWRGARG